MFFSFILFLFASLISPTSSWKIEMENDTNVTTLNLLLLERPDILRNETLLLFKMAEQSLRKQGKLPDTFRFNVTDRPTCTFSQDLYQFQPVKEASQVYHETGIDAVIGPFCSGGMKQISQLAVQWNIPVIGFLSVDSALTERRLYGTLSRVSVTLSSLGQATGKLIDHLKWKKVGILKDETSYWGMSIYYGVKKALEERNITVNVDVSVAIKNIDDEIIGAWKELEKKARIIIITCSYYSPDTFLEAIAKNNMTQPGFLFVVPVASIGFSNIHLKSAMAREGYRKSLVITGQGQDQDLVQKLLAEMTEDYGAFLDGNYTDWEKTLREEYTLIHDAAYLYMTVVGELISKNETEIITDGKRFWELEVQRDFEGMSGHVWLDEIADRLPNYNVRSVYDGLEKKVMTLDVQSRCLDHCTQRGGQTLGKLFYEWKPNLVWEEFRDKMELPPDEPDCGYTGEKCDNTKLYVALGLGSLIIICSLFGWWRYKKYKEAEFHSMPWRVFAECIVSAKRQNSMMGSIASAATFNSGVNVTNEEVVTIGGRLSAPTCHRQLKNIDFKRNQLFMLNQIKALQHENITFFVGLCFNETENLTILWKLGSRGTLEDILFDMDLHLEKIFQASFISDIVKGLEFIHQSPVGVHGLLHANTCLVTSHWIVKLSHFGMQDVLYELAIEEQIHYKRESINVLLHVAPELLKQRTGVGLPMPASQKGDIYSLGLLIYEIIFRENPFYQALSNATAQAMLMEILTRAEQPVPKPHVPVQSMVDKGTISIMKSCWNNDPDARPTLKEIRPIARILSPMKGSLVDNMMEMMEKYAGNLEKLVKERTVLLEDAQKRADHLLFQMLPESVALDLKAGKPIEPKMFRSATVSFIDIVGFTEICSNSTPLQIVDFLNNLYSGFDAIITAHKCYKVETVGDAYLVVSGVPVPNEMVHARDIAGIAILISKFAENFLLTHRPNKVLQVRVGIASGPVAAGVIGLTAPRYCLFGDTVNTAARMESTGEPTKIQINDITKNLLDQYSDQFQSEERGLVTVKGKGNMTTYWMFKGPNFHCNHCSYPCD